MIMEDSKRSVIAASDKRKEREIFKIKERTLNPNQPRGTFAAGSAGGAGGDGGAGGAGGAGDGGAGAAVAGAASAAWGEC